MSENDDVIMEAVFFFRFAGSTSVGNEKVPRQGSSDGN
jgi:hypothetical protein